MICDVVFETIPEVQIHYQTQHIDQDLGANNSKLPTTKSSNSTNVSFLSSFQLPTDPISDKTPDSPTPQTLTFDVPSGLKTLQQQFECSPKGCHQKKKSTKSFANESKTKIGFKTRGIAFQRLCRNSYICLQRFGSNHQIWFHYVWNMWGHEVLQIYSTKVWSLQVLLRFVVKPLWHWICFSCVGCAKFYSKYLLKPVAYKMCENLGIVRKYIHLIII